MPLRTGHVNLGLEKNNQSLVVINDAFDEAFAASAIFSIWQILHLRFVVLWVFLLTFGNSNKRNFEEENTLREIA